MFLNAKDLSNSVSSILSKNDAKSKYLEIPTHEQLISKPAVHL
jgi:hypothetical protein